MSAASARVVARIIAAATAAGGTLAFLGWMGLSAAYAEPTPDPTPTSSVTPTPSPTGSATSATPAPSVEPSTPTPSPIGSATSASPAPSVNDATSTPTPTESETSPSPAPSTEGVTPTSIPTELSARERSAADRQGVAALAEPVADKRFGVVVLTDCAGEGDDTRVEVRLGLLTEDEDLTLDYVLTNDQNVTRTGTVVLAPEGSHDPEEPHAVLEFTGLPVGSYHIDFGSDGGAAPVTVQNFEILTCLITDVSCRQITISNPAANPAVGLAYGDGPGEHEEFEEFHLDPGESRVVRIDRGVIQLVGGTVEGGADENVTIANVAGEFEVSVPSDCGAAPPASGPDDGGTGPDNGLADTGGSAYVLGGLAGGSVLAAAGVTLLLRRRVT